MPPTRPNPLPPGSAKFIVGSVAQLRAKPEGGAAWLQGLRDVPYEGARRCLWLLPQLQLLLPLLTLCGVEHLFSAHLRCSPAAARTPAPAWAPSRGGRGAV